MARKAAASKRRAGPARKSSIRRRKLGSSRRTATASRRRWSQEVTEHSDALTLVGGVFTSQDPGRIAASLKRSAERSNRRKSDSFRSAPHAHLLHQSRRQKSAARAQEDMMQVKEELRRQFGRD